MLAKDTDNQVLGFSMNGNPNYEQIKIINYKPNRSSSSSVHPWVKEFETKVIRGEAAYKAALQLKADDFYPDAIIAHPGWGESLFLKDVWPKTKLGIYCEYFYRPDGGDVGFDPEFKSDENDVDISIKMKNINNFMHFEIADSGISPTEFQANTFPKDFRTYIDIIHDGINTDIAIPDKSAYITINNTLRLDKSNEIITFINRNLEPYRGYHIFMRALPALLKAKPHAHVIIVGGDKVSYGRAAPEGQSWKLIFLNEVLSELDKSRVHFVGNLSYKNYLKVLQVSTVHVYLTYPFVLSWSLLEAMSVGCAVIGSKTAPVEEVIDNGKNGVLVDFFDKNALTDQILMLLDNSDLRKKLGNNARNTIIDHYDLNKICLPKQLNWATSLIDK
jgi:glycosyltransferase involved in cell wall biosynthesis